MLAGEGEPVRYTIAAVPLESINSLLPHSTGGWIAVSVGLVGFAAAVQQLTAAVFRRKYGRAEKRMLDILKKQVDAEEVERFAESAREQAERYEEQERALREQIRERIPLEAARLYYNQRIDALVASMGGEWDEYQALESQLSHLEKRAPRPLPEALGEGMRDRVVPFRVREKRHALQLRVLVFALFVLAIIPVSLAELISGWLDALFQPLALPLWGAYVNYSLAAGAVIGVYLIPPVWRRTKPLHTAASVTGAIMYFGIGLAFLSGAALSLWQLRKNYEASLPELPDLPPIVAPMLLVLVLIGATGIFFGTVRLWPLVRKRFGEVH